MASLRAKRSNPVLYAFVMRLLRRLRLLAMTINQVHKNILQGFDFLDSPVQLRLIIANVIKIYKEMI
jgi:hypothetical protein